MHPTVFWTILLLSSFSSFAGIEASLGDRSYDFQSCVSRCVGERCRSSAASTSLEVPLRLMWWTCRENCSYTCMRSVTADDVRLNRPIRQFYGKVCVGINKINKKLYWDELACTTCACMYMSCLSYTCTLMRNYVNVLFFFFFCMQWPFIRFYGIQEPASVLFSLLNGATVTVGYVKYSRVVRNTYDSLFAVQCQFWVSVYNIDQMQCLYLLFNNNNCHSGESKCMAVVDHLP